MKQNLGIGSATSRVDESRICGDNTRMKAESGKQSFFEIERPEYFFWGAFILASFLFLFPSGTIMTADEIQQTAPEKDKAANPFETLELEARAAIAWDTETKSAFFEKNALEPLPLASLTKIMTAVTALSLVPETTLIPINDEALREEGDAGLYAGDKWLLRDLLKLTLLQSSNDGAQAIAAATGAAALGNGKREEGRSFFVKQMNNEARKLGLASLFFRNETGLDVSLTVPGGYGSARDIAILFSRALSEHKAIFEPTKWEQVTLNGNGRGGFDARNTNRETGRFPLLLASKTGYTDLAGGNLALAFDAPFNRPIIVVVLGSTYEGRFADAEKLVWATFEYLVHNR